jgi:hypothetical protein
MVDPTDDRRPFEHPLIRSYHPRFTSSEIALLNLLVNRAPGYASIREIKQTLAPLSYYGHVTDGTLTQHLVKIRQKIGEPVHAATRILPVKEMVAVEGYLTRRKVVGYRWVDRPEIE